MKISIKHYLLLAFLVFLSSADILAQDRIINRGTSNFRKVGVHRGNQVRTVFSNYGVIAQPGTEGPRGAWKFDANGYVGDVSPVVGLRLPIRDYRRGTLPQDGVNDTIYSVVITPVDRPGGGEGGGGKSYTFEPIPGFADPILDEIGKGVAMSHQTETWPQNWPDYPSWTYSGEPIIVDGVDKTPNVDWNGFFGRAQLNADQESYFWMDDNNDEENYLQNDFSPDANDVQRRGHGLQVSVRGLQWSNFLAQDVVFWLYNIKNDGTETYDQAVFGTVVGTYVGVEDPEWNDDASFFNVRESITYTWDFDHYINPAANPKWLPDPTQVGYIAYAFLESPGNSFDGIDNDGDNATIGTANYFAAEDFPNVSEVPAIVAGDKLILIDKTTYERTSFTVPNDTVTVVSLGVPFFIQPGVTKLVEGNINLTTTEPIGKTARDGIDNDLDGLIDENYQVHYRQFKKSAAIPPALPIVLIDTLAPVQYRDYLAGGNGNPLIDESRDDGIDNDGDWTAEFDDVGADGKAGTFDIGEGDGIPTAGEPNFDATDVDESDQIGLTSFQYFVPAGDIAMSDDANLWGRMLPGYFQVPSSIVNNVAIRGEDGDFLYGSGYFPLLAGKTERFSLALAFGSDFSSVLKAKQIAQTIYNANYNFPRPPDKPTLNAVAENGKITLYWDRVAENSVDPTLKVKDFEGYKIYKGTDPDLTDALLITNASGDKVFYKPVAQFDLINGISGIFPSSTNLITLTDGAPFNLGTDNGIQNYYVDNNVINGRTYYYALVAYDRGDASKDIYPSENTRFISKDALGRISTDINTVAVTPSAPVAGYVPPPSGINAQRVSGFSTPVPFYEVVDPIKMNEGTYTITFNDSLRKTPDPLSQEKSFVNISSGYSVSDPLGNVVLSDKPFTPSNGIVFDGVRLSLDSSFQRLDSVKLKTPIPGAPGSFYNGLTGWNIERPKNLKFTNDQVKLTTIWGTRFPRDYMLTFSDTYSDSSNKLTELLGSGAPPAKLVNFKAFDITDRNNPKRVQFVFLETKPYRRDTLSFGDNVIFSDPTGTELSWRFTFTGSDSSEIVPAGGDTLFLRYNKPISGNDKFTFTTTKASYDLNSAREQLNLVKAVPNPYIVANVFEEPLPPTVRGRGERVIYFINLPPKSKVHIYTSSGNHVRSLEHDGSLNDGSLEWDLRTKEGLDIAFGVYFYVVEVEGISDKKTGKLAIIK
ncbi:MAG: hypothetical protein IPJ23_11770 [Ignavibacteriales bacterium]|nr:hypothetical protein [Ignavibacteriales bacterium]